MSLEFPGFRRGAVDDGKNDETFLRIPAQLGNDTYLKTKAFPRKGSLITGHLENALAFSSIMKIVTPVHALDLADSLVLKDTGISLARCERSNL